MSIPCWPASTLAQPPSKPVALRSQFLAAPELDVKKTVLDRRVANYEKNKPVVAAKSGRIKLALTLLTISIVAVVAGETYYLLTKH